MLIVSVTSERNASGTRFVSRIVAITRNDERESAASMVRRLCMSAKPISALSKKVSILSRIT
ncbi:hypothetical protein BCR44DRAFT_1443552, partial [Catenaria anguillulae PL171]